MASDRKQISGGLGMEGREGRRGGHKETEGKVGVGGPAHYLGCGNSFTSVYICQRLLNCTMWSLLNVSYTSTKQFKKIKGT